MAIEHLIHPYAGEDLERDDPPINAIEVSSCFGRVRDLDRDGAC